MLLTRDKPDDFLEDADGDVRHATDKLFKVLRCDKWQKWDRYDSCHTITYSIHLHPSTAQLVTLGHTGL